MWHSNETWADELRPDKCDVMIEELTTTNTVIAYSTKNDAWINGPAKETIKKLVKEKYSWKKTTTHLSDLIQNGVTYK
jgi:hypothetical protein